MRMILSPTKKMQSGSGKDRVLHRPQFLEETVQLWEVLREFASYELESAFRINPQLALQAACDFQDFSPEAKGEAALFSYIGLAFSNLQPETFSGRRTALLRRNVTDSQRVLWLGAPIGRHSALSVRDGLQAAI